MNARLPALSMAAITIAATGLVVVGLISGQAYADEPVPCADLLFIGAPGSGQSGQDGGYGSQMFALSQELGAQLPPGLNYASEPLIYPAYDFSLLVADELSIPRGNEYGAGILAGDTALADRLTEVRSDCPDERVVLGGYSSGAMVVHDLLDNLGDSEYWRQHIVGVSLIADPRRSGTDIDVNEGTTSLDDGIAQWTNEEGVRLPSSIPPVFDNVTESWCRPNDSICSGPELAPIDWNLITDDARHTSYGTTWRPNLFTKEAARLARDVERSRERAPDTLVLLGQFAAGYPLEVSLAAYYSYPERFRAVGDLPLGLTVTGAGLLRGRPTQLGSFQFSLDVVSRFGDVTTVDYDLNIADPATVDLPIEPDPQTVPRLVMKQKINVAIPSVIPKSAVVIDNDSDPLPPGLSITAVGRLVGTPKIPGFFRVLVRDAEPNQIRRFYLELRITNPAVLVSADADGTPANSDVWDGIVLDPNRVAFVSDATDLGGPADDREAVYVKNTATGTLAHWTPPADEFAPELITGPDKADLYIATLSFDSDPDTGNFPTVIRSLHVASLETAGTTFTPSDLTEVEGVDTNSRSFAVTPTGLLVVSSVDLADPTAPTDGTQRLWRIGTGTPIEIPAPPQEGVTPWSIDELGDVRPDGAVLVHATALFNSDGWTPSIGAWFVYRPNGKWISADLDAAGDRITMASPVFYAGDIAFSAPVDSFGTAQASIGIHPNLIIVPTSQSYSKPMSAADPTVFGPPSSTGVTPLSASTWSDGCALFNRNDPDRVDVTTNVDLGDVNFTACTAQMNNATPYSASAGSAMLVSGMGDASPYDETRQLLLATIP